jgi:putative aminopeptidase FrvX
MKLNKRMLLATFAIQNPSRNRACNNAAMDVIESLAPAGDNVTVVRNGGNMLIRKGPASGPHPYYLAHMDQVHDYVPFMSLTISKDNTLSAWDGNDAQTGVGGDDKCGIYLALEMLHRLDHVTAVFVRDEEVGCLGSGVVPLEWFAHAAFVLQADRNNRTFDIIRETNGMCCASDEFLAEMLSLPACVACGHKQAVGSITDVGELAHRGLDVSMVNISSGYHNPHMHTEIVKLAELSVACAVALQAANALGHIRWSHTPDSTWYPKYTGKAKVYGDDWSALDDLLDGDGDSDGLNPPTVVTVPAGGYPSTGYREGLIEELELEGFDRYADGLDFYDTRALRELLWECDNAAAAEDDTEYREDADDGDGDGDGDDAVGLLDRDDVDFEAEDDAVQTFDLSKVVDIADALPNKN